MNPIKKDLVKAIEFMYLTPEEEKEAIFEAKKRKYFHIKNGPEFERRYPVSKIFPVAYDACGAINPVIQ